MGKHNSTTWGNQPESTCQGRMKRYRQRVKQYRKNRTFQNNERKFYQQLGGSNTKTYQQPDIKEILDKIWQPKKHNENAEWINNITRELEGLKEGLKMEIHVDLLKITLKRITNWKAPSHDGIHCFWLKKFTLHSRQTLALEINRCLQCAQAPEWMTKGKDYINPKGTEQRNCYKQLQTHNLPTNDVENTNSTNKGKVQLLTNNPRIVPWRTERMPQWIQRHSRITLHRSTQPKWEQDKTE